MRKFCPHKYVNYVLCYTMQDPQLSRLDHLEEPGAFPRKDESMTYSIKKTCTSCDAELGAVSVDEYDIRKALMMLYKNESGDYSG